MPRYLYIGTSTQEGEPFRPEGIFVYRMDPLTARLKKVHAIEAGPNPSFLAFSHDQRFLFSVIETKDGGACSFSVDPASGNLTFISRVKVNGDLPCYLSVDPGGQAILAASYELGSLTVIPVGAGGILNELSQQLRHQGAAAEPGRKLVSFEVGVGPLCTIAHAAGEIIPGGLRLPNQEIPHAHSIIFDPTRKYALSADLGMDCVWVYRYENSRLAANIPGETGQVLKPGAGPRHIAFHPNGRFAYVSDELDSTVTVFSWDGDHGRLRLLQNLSTIPADYSGGNDVAHVALTPDGRFLYVSNRGHNSLAIFRVDDATGLLTSNGHASTLGNWPRSFCIDPDGRFLIAANQFSNDIFVFAIDPPTGALQPTGESSKLPAPLFVTIVDLG